MTDPEPRDQSPAPPPPRAVGLGELVAPVRGPLALGAALAALAAVCGMAPVVAVAELARSLLGPAGGVADATLWTWVGAAVLGSVGTALLSLASSQVCHHADAEFRYRTRMRVVHHLGSLPLGWFGQQGSAEVKKAVADDVKQVHTIVAHASADLVRAAVAPVLALAYLFWVDWLLTAVLLVYLTVVAAVAFPRMQAGFRDNMDDYERGQAALGRAAVELADGVEVVKTYGHDTTVSRRFDRALDELSAVSLRWMAGIGGPNIAVTSLFSAAALAALLAGSGLGLVALGWTDPGTVAAVVAVGVGLPSGLLLVISLGYAFREAQVGAAHLGGILARQGLPEPRRPRHPTDAGVSLDDVTFDYEDGTRALHHVSVDLRPGRVTAVVGPSGSGKTTLARLIPRFWDVTSGHVRVGGVDVREIAVAELLGTVAFVFQDTMLLRDTVAANIRLGRPAASDEEVARAARLAHIDERIRSLPDGYETMLDGSGGALSGGEAQRVTIARAILQDAPIVVLDEATAHADPHSETAVQRALGALSGGRTLVVVAHRLHTVTSADHIVVLDGGHVVERGTHEELLEVGGLYHRLWERQQLTAGTSGESP